MERYVRGSIDAVKYAKEEGLEGSEIVAVALFALTAVLRDSFMGAGNESYLKPIGDGLVTRAGTSLADMVNELSDAVRYSGND